MRNRKNLFGSFLIGLIVLSLISGALMGSLIEKTDILPQLLRSAKNEFSTILKITRLNLPDNMLKNDVTLLFCADTLGKNSPPAPDLFWLIHYNSKLKKFSVIFIPPETMVDVSGRAREELSKVYLYGQRPLMMSAVNKLLGINVEDYLIFEPKNFNLFDDFGRIPIQVSQYVVDGPELGNQKLNGKRVRSYLSPQIGDTQDPQMRLDREKDTLLAIKSRLETLQLNEIDEAISKNYDSIKSSLTQREMEEFFRTVGNKDVKLQSETLPARFDSSPDYCYFDPKPDEIKNLVSASILGKTTAKPNLTPQLSQLKIEVLNGTGKTGMAREVARKLKEQGYNVPYVSRADRSDYRKTRISVFTQRSESDAARIKEILGIGYIKIRMRENPKVDIRVLVGRDYLDI